MLIDQPTLVMVDASPDRSETVNSEPRPARHAANHSLVERLDPALGEATSGIGALLTELVRRTLRGGVQKVDEELHSVVEEKIDATISIRMPVIEAAAHEAAESTAREVATAKVSVLEVETRATADRLTHEIAETAEQTAQKAETVAREMVNSGLAELEQRTEAQTKTFVQVEISELEKRAESRARDMVSEQIEVLKLKSKGTVDALTEHINKLHQHDKVLKKIVQDEVAVRKAESQKIQENVLQLVRETRTLAEQALDERSKALDAQMKKIAKHQSNEFDRRFQHLSDLNMALSARLTELEKPRGIKAVWLKLFGRKKAA